MTMHDSKINRQKTLGFSLIEMLIVVGIFSILAVVVTQSLSASLRSSRKSENLGKVRENLEYSLNYMERTLRAAKSLDFVDDPAVTGVDLCDSANLRFINSSGSSENFSLATGRIRYTNSSGTNYDITSTETVVSSVVFNCSQGTLGRPDSVEITVTARDASTSGSAESANYTTKTTISLRNYSRN